MTIEELQKLAEKSQLSFYFANGRLHVEKPARYLIFLERRK